LSHPTTIPKPVRGVAACQNAIERARVSLSVLVAGFQQMLT
jgi:hypothetical protein